MELTFKKEKSGKWYIVLPEWTGSKSDLEMVSGADDLLDQVLAENSHFIYGTVYFLTLDISLKKKKGYKHLTKIANTPLIGGAIYFLGLKPVWLCAVTKHVFGKMPKDIYFKAL